MHSQTLQGEEKRALPFFSKTARVQRLVSAVSEVTCATVRAEHLSTQQCGAGRERRTMLQAAVKDRDGAVWQSPDSSSGAQFEDVSGDTF